ncbi:MAG: UDP-N-acetylmuramoyl-tripeptide--D-alanyl-D-alanine ligase [Deltaproteobacteria bacterium]|nr:UDP-N-acetylmuramoyl-tripeptide--D-alanyl-D-alanine ligase [Deltaproteobacteria bacterium]
MTTAGKRPRPWPGRGGRKIIDLAAGEIARAVQGEILSGHPDRRAVGAGSDSRQVRPGELFVPLRGPRYDGHDFLPSALASGAAGALIQEGREGKIDGRRWPDKFLIRVGDPLRALGDLARFWRDRLPARVIAITGSNGKTTTKEMTARVLSGRFRVLKTEGNLNNRIGLPLMLLRLAADHEMAVLEMGMSEAGEIRRLKEIACPGFSLIANIGPAHLEQLGSLEGVSRAKGELWEDLKAEDWIAVNADDPRVVALAALARCRRRTFGLCSPADLFGEDLRTESGGISFTFRVEGKKIPVRLAAFGRHNVLNALAAAALCSAAGLGAEEIAAGLQGFQSFPGRGQVRRLGREVHILDESYNSNPGSLEAALAAFREAKGGSPGILVLGDMLELGEASARLHEESGRRIAELGPKHLFLLGEKAGSLAAGARTRGRKVTASMDPQEILEELEKVIQPGDWVLVKASRRIGLERIIDGLEDRLGRA